MPRLADVLRRSEPWLKQLQGSISTHFQNMERRDLLNRLRSMGQEREKAGQPMIRSMDDVFEIGQMLGGDPGKTVTAAQGVYERNVPKTDVKPVSDIGYLETTTQYGKPGQTQFKDLSDLELGNVFEYVKGVTSDPVEQWNKIMEYKNAQASRRASARGTPSLTDKNENEMYLQYLQSEADIGAIEKQYGGPEGMQRLFDITKREVDYSNVTDEYLRKFLEQDVAGKRGIGEKYREAQGKRDAARKFFEASGKYVNPKTWKLESGPWPSESGELIVRAKKGNPVAKEGQTGAISAEEYNQNPGIWEIVKK